MPDILPADPPSLALARWSQTRLLSAVADKPYPNLAEMTGMPRVRISEKLNLEVSAARFERVLRATPAEFVAHFSRRLER